MKQDVPQISEYCYKRVVLNGQKFSWDVVKMGCVTNFCSWSCYVYKILDTVRPEVSQNKSISKPKT